MNRQKTDPKEEKALERFQSVDETVPVISVDVAP